MIWAERNRCNKVRLQYNRIQRMLSPPTNVATDMHWMSHQTEKYKPIHRMFPPEKDVRVRIVNSTMMSYHSSATTTAIFSIGTMENHGGGWWNRWNTIQNRKSPDDGPLDKIRIPTKNDTPQTPHMFANTHHPSWPS
jgi:hypothetical protein